MTDTHSTYNKIIPLSPFLVKSRRANHRPLDDGSSFSYQVKNFWLRKLFKENHSNPVISSDIHTTLVATCSETQINLYDTLNYGAHFDFFLQFNLPEKRVPLEKFCCVCIPHLPEEWPDTFIMVASDIGMIRLISTRWREVIFEFSTSKKIISIKSHPALPLILFVIHSNSITMWNIATAKCLYTLSFPSTEKLRAFSVIQDTPTSTIFCVATFSKIYNITLPKAIHTPDSITTNETKSSDPKFASEQIYHDALHNAAISCSDSRLFSHNLSQFFKEKSPQESEEDSISLNGTTQSTKSTTKQSLETCPIHLSSETFGSWATLLDTPTSNWHTKPITQIELKFNSNGLVLISQSSSGKVVVSPFSNTSQITKHFTVPYITPHVLVTKFTTDTTGDWFICGNDAGDLVFYSLVASHDSIPVTPSKFANTPADQLLREQEEQYRTTYRDKNGDKIDYFDDTGDAYHLLIHRKSKYPILTIQIDDTNQSIYTTCSDGSVVCWYYLEKGYYDKKYRSTNASLYT